MLKVTPLHDLDTEQLAAVQAVRGTVCIVAGAGTGKTRTVTHRIAHAVTSGQVDPRTGLAITHSRKAAGELAERLRELGVGTVDSRTFHAAGLRVARHFWSRTGRPGAGPKVVSDAESWRLWRDALRAVSPLEPDTSAVRDVIDEVGWARSRLVGADDYPSAAVAADRHPGVSFLVVVDAWSRFNEVKTRRGLVDFADLLEIASDLLVSDAEVAEQVRRRWAYVTVDEYQDTDAAQQRLLDAVLGGRDDLCVVGDPRQAIYSWKGADPQYLSGFTRRYPSAQVFELTRNYRSTPQILDWANRIAVDQRARALVATRSPGTTPAVTQCEDETAEARWVATRAAKAMAAGTPASEIAVLYRFNATQGRFEAALARADIATVVAEDTTFFDREEIAAALIAFGQAARAAPDQPGLALFQSTLRRAGFDRDAPPSGQGAARTRWESQRALLDLVEAWPDAAGADAAGLSTELEKLAARTHGPQVAGVTLATLHRAKGLEWDVVFLVGVHDGAIPSSYATTAEEKAEEERLLYVGMTRARRELHITWPATGARGWTNRPSPYLDLLPSRRRAAPPASRQRPVGSRREDRSGRGPTSDSNRGSRRECPHCMEPLKGISARRLGICAHCVTRVPGPTGERARALQEVIDRAAVALDVSAERLVSPAALLRLLEQRPDTAAEVCAAAGVKLPEAWAAKAAAVLAQ